MYDALMLAAIVDELNDVVLDGRVQRVLLLDPLTIGLEIYAGGRHQLLLSADAREARLHLVGAAGGRLTGDAAKVTPLLLLLRKWVRGARLVRVYQEPPLERVAFLRFARFVAADSAPPDDEEFAEDDEPVEGELVETTLAVEIMGRHSNLVLLDAEGLIMDSAKRVPSRLSRVRPVLPKQRYVPVPPQDKADPRAIAPAGLAALLAATPETPLAQVLVGSLRGVSPQTAREAAFRATGATRTAAGEAVAQVDALRRALDEIFAPLATGAWSPRLYLRAPEGDPAAPGRSGRVLPLPALSPARTPRGAVHQPVGGDGALLRRDRAGAGPRAAQGDRGGGDPRGARTGGGARASAGGGSGAGGEAERWRRYGEAIYAYGWTLAPGQHELVADDLTVPLDPAKSPSENAQDYFERYRKAQGAAEQLPALLNAARVTIAYLDQLLALLALASTYPEIEALKREWDDWRAGRAHSEQAPTRPPQQGKRKPAQARGGPRPQPVRARGGHLIYIGHTGAQNDAVTFDIAGPGDTWLHGRGVPGSHVIVKWADGREDDAVLQAAAELAAYYSAGRESGAVEVDIAARRDVRKIKGAGPGLVTYRNERTVRVTPRGEDEVTPPGRVGMRNENGTPPRHEADARNAKERERHDPLGARGVPLASWRFSRPYAAAPPRLRGRAKRARMRPSSNSRYIGAQTISMLPGSGVGVITAARIIKPTAAYLRKVFSLT